VKKAQFGLAWFSRVGDTLLLRIVDPPLSPSYR